MLDVDDDLALIVEPEAVGHPSRSAKTRHALRLKPDHSIGAGHGGMNEELAKARAREAATREILEVISRSRDDDRPVFDSILEQAAKLCNATLSRLYLANDARTHYQIAAAWGQPYKVYKIGDEFPLDKPRIIPTTIREGRFHHVPDLAETESYRTRELGRTVQVEQEGYRTFLTIPLMDGGVGIGCIALVRTEVAPFSDADIELVKTFAAQAVIAIENVRQFRAIQAANAELQSRLSREAATREILEVISQSRDDERPVFDLVLRKSANLCGASMASLNLVDMDHSRILKVAEWGDQASDQLAPGMTAWAMDAGNAPAVCIRECRIEHLHDMANTDLYRSGDAQRVAAVDGLGIRTFLAVPLFDGDHAVGCISVYRHEVKPFSPDEITLLETFAAQAVIAIDSVRQFRELQDRLEREAATRNILRVISEYPDDEQPTFEAILDSATRLCGTQYASIVLGRRGDASQRMVAHRADTAETLALFREGKVPMDPEDSIAARAILEARTIQVPDMADTDQYRAGHERFRLVVDRLDLRTNLFVPLLGPEGGIGCLMLWKKEVAPFTADQIGLMETFASHAVIAIENVRQFKALEALNAELGDRVQAQVGEIERMGRLKRFLPAAVADTVISSGSEKLLSSHRALLGVLFCDIRGFTAFCETAEPEETIEVLQTYHEEMGKLINAHGAGVDHRIGDGIMVLFNDPLPCDDPAGTAVRLALAMRDRMADLCAGWKRMGHRLGFGVGISLGYATVGMVGSGGRFDYTASGTAINLASRLADEAQDGEILLSPRARTAVEDRFPVELRGELTLKGIREPVEVFRLTGIAAA